ncbi:MAG TPA: ATP-dependent helicase, partial [Mycobacterium sp.]|nr:ATP-dependent helicase [Mycobacterium sp.]
AGSAGDVVTVVLPEQRKETQLLLRRAGIAVTPQQVTAGCAPVQALVGEVAPLQPPAPKATAPVRTVPADGQQRRAGGGRQRRRGGSTPLATQGRGQERAQASTPRTGTRRQGQRSRHSAPRA